MELQLHLSSEFPGSFFILMAFVMSVVPEFEAANAKYAARFTKGELPLPPARYTQVFASAMSMLTENPGKSLFWHVWTRG